MIVHVHLGPNRIHHLFLGRWFKTTAASWDTDTRCVAIRSAIAWDTSDHPFIEADQIDCMVYITELPPLTFNDPVARLVVFDRQANFYL
jgi:hypothetical protein